MIARVASLWDRFATFLRAPAPPVLAPYQRRRSPLEDRAKKLLFFSVLILVGAIYGFLYALLPPAFLLYLIAPIAILALIVVWALPDRTGEPPVAMERFFWGFWLAMILWPNYLAIALPGLPWITMARLFGGPLMLLLLITTSTNSRFRKQVSDAIAAAPVITKLIVAFAIVQLLSIFLSGKPYLAVNRFINNQIVWTGMFFVSVYVFLKPGRVAAWVYIFCVMAVIISIIGVVEYRAEQVLWANHVPSFLKIEDEAVQRMLGTRFRAGEYRTKATFPNSLQLSEFLALSTAFILHISVKVRSHFVKMVAIAADLLVLLVILLTQSRLGMVGFMLSHSIYWLVWAAQRWRTDRTSLLGPGLTLAYPGVLAIVAIAVLSIGRLRVRVIGGDLHSASDAGREAQWALAPPKILERPLFGHGPGLSGEVLGATNLGGELSIDSYFLSVLLDYGVVGFFLYYSLLIYGIYKASVLAINAKDEVTSYALPAAITLVVFLTIKAVLSSEHSNFIPFMLLGMIVALSKHVSDRDNKARG